MKIAKARRAGGTILLAAAVVAITTIWYQRQMQRRPTAALTAPQVRSAQLYPASPVILAADAGAQATGYRITAWIERPFYMQLDPIVLEVRIQNTTDKPLSYPETEQEIFDIEVKDGKDRLVPLTRFGQMTYRPMSKSALSGNKERIKVDLPPGKTVVHKVLLNALFDMSLPGSYSVSAKKSFNTLNGMTSVEVISNRKEIVVGER